MFKTIIKFVVTVLIISISITNQSNAAVDKYCNPFYIGITNGYGSTTWGSLVPKDPDTVMALSTPVHVSEGGYLYGAYVGYEFIPQFAIEASYMHYPNAELYFDEFSLFALTYGITQTLTRTQSFSVVGKFMLEIPHADGFRAYATAGAAEVYRDDSVAECWRLSPTFGVGFNYTFTSHIMAELGTEYVAGYGQSEINPAVHYIPFLYSAFLRLAYRM